MLRTHLTEQWDLRYPILVLASTHERASVSRPQVSLIGLIDRCAEGLR